MMKKVGLIGILGLMAALENLTNPDIIETMHSKASIPKEEPLRRKFADEPTLVKLIKQYILIKKGESKLGKRKQALLVMKIDAWLDSGMLIIEDIKNINNQKL